MYYLKLFTCLMCYVLTSATLKGQDIVPFRADSTYVFELDYNFKTKPAPPDNEVSFTEYYDRRSEILPYVKVKIALLDLKETDFRIKVVDNKGTQVLSRKIRPPMELNLDMGFAEDIKERLVPYLYNVYFFDKEKNIHSRITIEVTETGDFLLNNQIYGKL